MSELIKEYADGLFAAAVEAGVDSEILMESRVLSEVITNEYARLLSNPEISKSERIGLVSELLDERVQPYLANFVKLMVERNIVAQITECFSEFERRYYDYHGIIRVRAESAVSLSDSQRKRLAEKLEAHTGHRVEIEYFTDKALIGGMKLSFDNRQIDSTIKNKLKEIGVRLTNTVI